MNTEKIKTLEQVDIAIEIVEDVRAVDGLTPSEKLALETISEKLRNVERTLIRMVSNELVDSLTSDANALNDLANQIKRSAGKLGEIANTIQKTASIVEAFITIVTTAVSAGFL